METQIEESTFINPEGIKLFRKIYQPIDSPIKAFVYLCHGLFEHSQSSYLDTIINPLRKIGCLILAHDNYGHGRSEGDRGILYNIDILVRDVLLDIEQTITGLKLPGKIPVFIYGHSLGGLVAVHASLQKKNYFRGLMLEAPALEVGINKAVLLMIKVMNSIYPNFKLGNDNYEMVCRNIEHIEDIKRDEYQILTPLTALTAQSIVVSVRRAQSLFKEFDSPVVIGHGDDDKLCLLKGSQKFMKQIISGDKTLVVYPKARHRLRMEIDYVDVEFREKIVCWVQERINLKTET